MIRRPPRSTRVRSSAASDVYKRDLLAELGDAFLQLVLGDDDPTDCGIVHADAPVTRLRAARTSESCAPPAVAAPALWSVWSAVSQRKRRVVGRTRAAAP